MSPAEVEACPVRAACLALRESRIDAYPGAAGGETGAYSGSGGKGVARSLHGHQSTRADAPGYRGDL